MKTFFLITRIKAIKVYYAKSFSRTKNNDRSVSQTNKLNFCVDPLNYHYKYNNN